MNEAAVAAVDTPFGMLNLDGKLNHVNPQRLHAEQRGLNLLKGIVDRAATWKQRRSRSSGNVILVSEAGGYELRLNVVGTVERYLLHNDPHLRLSLVRGKNRTVGYCEEICILFNQQHPGCAIADGLVSLVLLGEAEWPAQATPEPLRRFTDWAERERIARRWKLGIIELTAEDIDEINDVREAMELGVPHAALDMLCAFARRCYTCKGLDIGDVSLHLKALFEEFDPEDIKAYAASPSTPSDRLFLPLQGDAVAEQPSSAAQPTLIR